MKKRNETIIILGTVVFMTIFIILNASAESTGGFNITPMMWRADWDRADTSASTSMYGLGVSFSDGVNTFGATFDEGEFKFEEVTKLIGSDGVTVKGEEKKNRSFDRSDIKIYYSNKIVDPFLSLNLAYKIIEYEIKGANFLFGSEELDNSEVKIEGFGLGASGAIPIRGRFYMYYMVSFFPSMEDRYKLRIEYQGESYSEEYKERVDSFNYELGIGCIINKRISAYLGLKSLKFDYKQAENEAGEGYEEKLTGITLRINFGF